MDRTFAYWLQLCNWTTQKAIFYSSVLIQGQFTQKRAWSAMLFTSAFNVFFVRRSLSWNIFLPWICFWLFCFCQFCFQQFNLCLENLIINAILTFLIKLLFQLGIFLSFSQKLLSQLFINSLEVNMKVVDRIWVALILLSFVWFVNFLKIINQGIFLFLKLIHLTL